MVTYNSATYLRKAISSVLSSTYPNFELLIRDDHSQDESWNIIKSFTDGRIRKKRNSKNIGEYQNRNKCIEEATGEFLIFIDGDDYIYPWGLDYLAENLKGNEDIGMVLGIEWKEKIIFPFRVSPHDFFKSIYCGRNSIMGLNFTKILFNVDKLRSVGGLSNNFKTGDTYIQLLMGMNYPVLLIGEGFSWWRRRPNQASEKILKDGSAVAEKYGYLQEFLQNERCPLTNEEINLAKINHAGGFSRFLFNYLRRGELLQFSKLWKKSGFPLNNWKYFLSRAKRNFEVENV